MMHTKYFFYSFLISLFFISTSSYGQNFDETWIEFLDNNKISNMSRLSKPDKRYEEEDYAKYLLMNTNNCFCQSKIEQSEGLMAEIEEMDYDIQESIPGYVTKVKDLEKKLKASHEIDEIWERFLKTKDVTVDELEEVYPPSSICEKQTLVKYSYMTAHYYLCGGEYLKAKNTFEKRTLKIAEKTTLRVKDVKGLAPLVADMKLLFQKMPDLEDAWDEYIVTGVSPGFATEMPFFACFPIPKMKELILKGAANVCGYGTKSLKQFKKVQAEIGLELDWDMEEKLEELEAAVEERASKLDDLNVEWDAFIKNNRVKNMDYGYDYCNKEALIRAHIMDGFAFVCETAEEALFKIDSLQRSRPPVRLDKVTKAKIKELKSLKKQYQANGVKIDMIWEDFIAQGDTLIEDFDSTDKYCDHIQEVKDWTMKGLSADGKAAIPYLEKIEEFSRTSEFKFYKELECRVRKLKIKVWDFRYNLLLDLAKFEAEDGPYEERLQELMAKYEMEERPEVCSLDD